MDKNRFIADCMLGKLARWLRILSFDTQYVRYLTDAQLLAQARYQNRILLTKDSLLQKKAKNFGYLVRSETIDEQLKEILHHFQLRPNLALTRCPHCNFPLKTPDQNDPIPWAPLYVLRSFSNIKVCPQCGQTFWPGTHWNNIIKKLESINFHINE
ncbi:MAG: hypothetical protein GX432_14010 [Candidatus Atribacteria bacterium]|nr:hypothetical protein [Candidatus Atribacteria bacterium]